MNGGTIEGVAGQGMAGAKRSNASPWPFEGLKPRAYDLILCDWPWPFTTFSAKGQGKSAARHYASTIEPARAPEFPVGQLAAPRGALLVFWSTWSRLAPGDHLPMFAAWGCRPSSGGCWAKVTRNGLPSFGPGYILRDACEPFITGILGKRAPAALRHTERNLILAEVREHSRKPEEMHRMLERLAPDARKCELFARQRRAGWDSFGNELDMFPPVVGLA
ncbi:MT-A70 family methyltransferase [Azospirillum sp. B4]|uniref:MT-A70 family methyltransferase n=1 Tax=Azospirillum sp. B4 TaxID=95605 RepID=UPI000A013F9D|nr:MT-A70 family methyltransferase [Azospirillum sp. B4]